MPSRRPAPILFSAFAATVVLLPWAIYGMPDERADSPPVATTPMIVEQPLTGVGGGETIRDVHQDTPFSMVALTADDLTGTQTRVRARKPDGSWGPWYEAEALEGVGDASAKPRGTDPVFVGKTTDVQISVRRPEGAQASLPLPSTGPTKPGLGYVPANAEAPLGPNFTSAMRSLPSLATKT